MINEKIYLLFSTPVATVIDTLTSLVINGSILGQELTTTRLGAIIGEKKLQFRNKGIDNRIKPRLHELNIEYKDMFFPLKNGLIKRPETKYCLEAIEKGESLIISGKAGTGKSGCTHEVISYCEKAEIPYIAIKLDKHVPTRTSEIWGINLGLPESIPFCLHKISINEKAVIILDQLDALRWTQSNSSEAITVCMEIIRQVKSLNNDRKNKISIIFVCRTYDLENDNNIKPLFRRKETELDIWKKILINSFDDETVENIIGNKYLSMGVKTKELLRIPSNIYIWQQLDKKINYDDCLTTSHLVEKWYEQIKRKSIENGVSEKGIDTFIDQIVNSMEGQGRLYIPIKTLNYEIATLDYLKSSGMINVANKKLAFNHQSFIDYFISAKMFRKYDSGENILNIIGDKNQQTPARRYQIQMLMQEILADSSVKFLNFGSTLLESDQVRYYIKYIFYELLSQIDNPDKDIQRYIVKHADDEKLINIVFYTKINYISILREEGILDNWYNCKNKRVIVINLLKSISPIYDENDVKFIREHALNTEKEAKMFLSCFRYDINSDTDYMFELRMDLYKKYPILAKEAVINFKSMLTKCEMRAIRLLALWLEQKNRKQESNLFGYEEDLLHVDDDIFINNGYEILDMLLKFVPLTLDNYYGEWSSRDFKKDNLERACVEIIKKANIAVIKVTPQDFFNRYQLYWSKEELVDVFNELVLDGFYYLSENYSDQIMRYFIKSSKHNLVDNTSGANNKLMLLKRVLKKHTRYCKKEVLDTFVTQVIFYKPTDMVDIYKRRIKYNKMNEYARVYWPFWGDFQYEVLQSIADNRLTDEGHSLLNILRRRFRNLNYNTYYSQNSHFGWVSSPVSKKTISTNNWLKIIKNKKLLNNQNRNNLVRVEGGFFDSSIESFANDFTDVVMKDPRKMISIIIENKNNILEEFINALFTGVARSKLLHTLDKDLIINMFINFPYDLHSLRAHSFCEIVGKRSDIDWPEEILKSVIDIASNHNDTGIKKLNVTEVKGKEVMTCEIIQSNELNCVRSNAVRTIGSLLSENIELFDKFKSTIKKLSEDKNIIIRYASLWSLLPAFNINQVWASNLMITVYESDIRLCCFHNTRHIFHLLSAQYKHRVNNLIRACLNSNENSLIKLGAYCLVDKYLMYGTFEEVISNVIDLSEKQAQYILKMVITYYNDDKYNSQSKNIILEYFNKRNDLGNAILGIFYEDYISISRDKEFLLKLVETNAGKKIIAIFVNYLERTATQIIDFSDVILKLCDNILSNTINELNEIGMIEDDLSKLIINLYDESIEIDPDITLRCMELWDIMFEKQIGSIRKFSKELMDR